MKSIIEYINEGFFSQPDAKKGRELKNAFKLTFGKSLPPHGSYDDTFSCEDAKRGVLISYYIKPNTPDRDKMDAYLELLHKNGCDKYNSRPATSTHAEVNKWLYKTQDYSIGKLGIEEIKHKDGTCIYKFYYSK